jgi:protein SCO1/2
MNKLGLTKKIIILVLILALPGFLYYLLTAEGKNRYKPLPFYGPKQLAKTSLKVNGKNIPDTVYHTLPDFSLYDQDGHKVSAKTFNNKIFVASFFYIHCPTVCNTVNNNIKALLADYTKNKMVYFVSITVDPQRDQLDAIKKYSKQFNPPGIKWLFLTGDTSVIYPLARKGFLVDALKTGDDSFVYSDKLILVDQDKHIRGYYSGTSSDEITRLDDEIKVLIAEELRKNDKPLY